MSGAAVVEARGFPVWVLRGVGQVMFQNNAWAGLLFLAGIAWNSVLFAAGAALGTAASTAAARLLGAERRQVEAGLYGFNGGLVAVALLYFLQPVPLTWALVIAAAGASSVVMAAFSGARLPALTAPFVVVALTVFLAAARFGRLPVTDMLPMAGLPRAARVEGVVGLGTVAEGVFTGLGQVFFQQNTATGLLFAMGLLIASRRACIAAVVGSFAGLVVAWGMGAAEPALRAGAYGFNSALVAIALATAFVAPGRAAWLYALAAACATPFVVAAAAAALQPLGLPALTLPFVLVTWTALFGARAFPALRAA